MKEYLALINFIMQWSTKLNTAYYVHPNICIIFGAAAKNQIEGACIVLYRRDAMYIEINLPWKQQYTANVVDSLICALTHEYAHYIYALKLSPQERVEDTQRYLNDATYKRSDEQRTWIHTKKMLIALGYWRAPIRKACTTFLYSWAMKEK